MRSPAYIGRPRITIRQLFLFILLALLALSQLFPLVWLFNYSLQKSGDLFGKEIFKLPDVPQWQNYIRAWRDGRIMQYLTNSVIVVAFSILLIMIFSFMLAYACTRMKWKLRNIVYGFVLMGMVIPIHTTLLPNFIWFKNFSLIDTRAGVIIPYIAFNMAFSVLLFRGFLASIPYAMEESAYLDGASARIILMRIIAPMAKTGFVTVGITAFLNCWNEFIMANTFLSSEVKRTLPFSIIRFQGQYASDYAVQFACMVIVAIIPIIIYFLFSKWIIAGVTAGSVKG
ncbi:MAG: carbohydrate ABC transporter permease [Spirochaetia bacterium]|nr:carbohydrate ABC transporter permease [Spirochaetia bacterium]MCF7942761.1 carbohydrate ABC transporter permease [Spirochaetia bacterium]